MIDVADVKAGDYKLVVLQWDQETGTEPYWDPVADKSVERTVYTRRRSGDVVTLDAAEARRLLRGGAVVPVDEYDGGGEQP